MLKQTDKDKLKALGLDIDAIVIAHADTAEKDITVPDGQLYTAETLATRDANLKLTHTKEGEKTGEEKALAIAIAEINKSTGLTLKADRFGDLAKQLKEHMGKSDDEKSKAQAQQITDLLAAKTATEKERDDAKAAADTIKFNFQQFGNMPENRGKNFNENEYLNLLSLRGVEVKTDGVYRNGELMKDPATLGALNHKTAFSNLFTEFKWTAEAPAGAQGGRGGGNSGGSGQGGKSRTMTEATEKWKAIDPNNTNALSAEFQTFLATETKDNPTFSYE